MARSDKRYMVYPSPRAAEIIGGTAPALNQAIECWAAELARATAQNSRDFLATYFFESPDRPGQCLHEWAVLADSIKDKPFDPEFSRPGDLLAAAVEDAHRFENVGDRWYGTEGEGHTAQDVNAAVSDLATKLRNLDYRRAWAIIVAVQSFWDHHKGIKVGRDEWWTLAFRRRLKPEQADKQDSQSRNSRPQDRTKKKPAAEEGE